MPSKPLTVSQKTRTTSGSSSDDTSDGDEDSDDCNSSDDGENDVTVAVELPPPILDKITEPADDSTQQVLLSLSYALGAITYQPGNGIIVCRV